MKIEKINMVSWMAMGELLECIGETLMEEKADWIRKEKEKKKKKRKERNYRRRRGQENWKLTTK